MRYLSLLCLVACSVPRGSLPEGGDAGPIDSSTECPEGSFDLDGDGLCECVASDEDLCDGMDNDCDGSTDEGPTDGQEGDPRVGNECDGDDEDECADAVTSCVGGEIVCVDDVQNPEHVEQCLDDLVDEDCDGLRNEGCSCNEGMTMQCGSDVGACEFGVQTCVDGVFGEDCEGGVLPDTETCNNIDDDCNGAIDNGVFEVCMNRCGDGGSRQCVAGAFQDCDAPAEPMEVCNNADDDCDGSTDESLNRMCMNDCGTSGMETCNAGVFQGCTAPMEPAETCNDMDDDCDGSTDEGLTRACMNACGTGGTEVCTAGTFGMCDAPMPPPEECNDRDDDCDGSTDESLTRPCMNRCGATGTETCSGGSFGGCDAPMEPTEVCNGLDDDCDGTTDEDTAASVEMCNGIDDDCDGDVDEVGCPCDRVVDPSDANHVYLFCNDDKRSFVTGSAFCATVGYHLVNVETEPEHMFVWNTARGFNDDHWLIGVRDQLGSGADDWEWTDGTDAHPTDSGAYDGWRSGDPNGSNRCARMNKDDDGEEATFSGGGWEDRGCGDENWIICEIGD